MPIEIRVPRLGWSMEEGLFSAWLKKEGEAVKAGDALFVLESEKAQQEVESLDEGTLHIPPSAPQPGETVKVGQLLAYLLGTNEAPPTRPLPSNQAVAQPAPVGEEFAAREHRSTAPMPGARPERSRRVRAQASTPRARRAARELNIDWRTIAGSGRSGRIRERDVRAAVMQPGGTISTTRRLIAEKMTTSWQRTVPVTLHATADATGLVQLRAGWKKTEGLVPSFNDALIKLSAVALKQHPLLNARWDGEHLTVSQPIHVGLAVDLEAGLIVPVIRHVERLSLSEVAARSRELVAGARQRRLTPEDLRGGTFTISNLGAFGIDAFTPVINYPEAAILGVGRIERRPTVVAEQIVARDIITLSLTFDHRGVDGAPAARFLQTLRRLIESPTEHLK